MKFIEMKSKDIKELRYKIWLKNNKKCPVLNKEILFEHTALDHAYKLKDEEYGVNKGTIREVLDFRVNSVLGKLENSLKRYGLAQQEDFDLPTFLRLAADYFERGSYQDEDGNYYIHPKEVKKEPPVSKRNYNLLKKEFNKVYNRKFPDYPKSKKLTKQLSKLFEEFNISPYN